MRIWCDITNTPQVHLLLAIINGLEEKGLKDFIITARDFSETTRLLSQKSEIPFQTIGSHQGKNLYKKATGLINRFIQIYKEVNAFDISISCGSESAIWSSYLKRKKSIAFGDNDLAKQWTYSLFVDHVFFPKCIPSVILHRQGISRERLYQYDGFKEHIYIADYLPDQSFKSKIPFEKYVVVRAENIQANYLGANSWSITTRLLKLLSDKKINVLFLPRYKSDIELAKGITGVYTPDNPVNGLDAAFFSEGVFTGAGTFAREAACLGVPSFSFFAGKRLLAVDNELMRKEKIFHSRNPVSLVDKFLSSDKGSPDLKKAKDVKDEVISKLIEIFSY